MEKLSRLYTKQKTHEINIFTIREAYTIFKKQTNKQYMYYKLFLNPQKIKAWYFYHTTYRSRIQC